MYLHVHILGNDRGGLDEQKIVWEGGSKMHPWGDIGLTIFADPF